MENSNVKDYTEGKTFFKWVFSKDRAKAMLFMFALHIFCVYAVIRVIQDFFIYAKPQDVLKDATWGLGIITFLGCIIIIYWNSLRHHYYQLKNYRKTNKIM